MTGTWGFVGELWAYVSARPWIWIYLAVATAVWIASLVVIFRSPKFAYRRKWLWVLLSLISLSWGWSISDDTMFGLGLPVGSFYVLWFWRNGRQLTAEDVKPKPAGPV